MGSSYPASQAIEAAWRVPGIVAGSAPAAERAEAVFDELRHVLPYAAVQLARWDAAHETHRVIASRGYSAAVLASLHSENYRNDRVWPVIANHPGGPLFWDDCPFDRKGSGFYTTVLEPNGFGEGATMLFRSHDGEYLGMLTANLEEARAPVEATRALLGVAGAALLPLVAPDRNAHALVLQCAPDADAVAVRDADGAWHPLRHWPMPPAELLAHLDGSSLPPRARFPWFDEREHGRGVSAHVQVLPTGDLTYPTVLTLQRARTPFGLTRREVQVLSLVAGGLSNADIAARLHLSTRTVGTHMDHVLGKLQVTSRTAAAIKALEHAVLSAPLH